MPTPNPQVKFTYEDYLLFPDDGKRHELIDGDHYVTPAPKTKHQRVSSNLHRILGSFVYDRRLGQVFAAPTDVVLSEIDVVQPDVIFISSARMQIITENNIDGAPDLAIEILSETTRKTDEIIKRKRYERFGVPEYWIVDPELETVKVYRASEGGQSHHPLHPEEQRVPGRGTVPTYVRTGEFSKESNDTLTTPALPGLHIPLAAIFE